MVYMLLQCITSSNIFTNTYHNCFTICQQNQNQNLQERNHRMSETLKSGIIVSFNMLSHILKCLTLQFSMKTVLHIEFKLRSQTDYI